MKRGIILGALVLAVGLVSCKKEGCIDADATNYDEKAKVDNGSCTYQANFAVWFNQTTAENMAADGITELSFYIGGNAFGTLSVDDYSTTLPDCTGNTGLSTVVDLGTDKKTYDLELKYLDNFGVVQGSGSYPGIEANSCREYEITY